MAVPSGGRAGVGVGKGAGRLAPGSVGECRNPLLQADETLHGFARFLASVYFAIVHGCAAFCGWTAIRSAAIWPEGSEVSARPTTGAALGFFPYAQPHYDFSAARRPTVMQTS